MSETDSKRHKRLERKKRKVQAFLEVASLNDQDRLGAKKAKLSSNVDNNSAKLSSDVDNNTANASQDDVDKKKHPRYSDKPLLEGAEYEELKKRLKERKKSLQSNPEFRPKTVGEMASVTREKRTPLFMSDIQHLLLYCLCGDRAPYQPHR